MDFPKSVPSVGLVDGKFIDEDAVRGTPGSLIPSAWGNAVTLEVLNVIEAAGLDPDEDNNAQLLQAIDVILTGATPNATETVAGLIKLATQLQVDAGTSATEAVTPEKLASAIRNQTLAAYTTAGAIPDFTLAPAPAIAAYAANQRFRIKFNAAAPVNGTLNVSGKGAKNLKQYDAFGAKVSAVIAAGQLADVEYDGTDFVLLDPLPTPCVAISGSARNLRVSAVGTNAVVAITADEIIVVNAVGQYQTLKSVSVSLSLAASGLNGLDTGSLAANTWYYTFVIWNPATLAVAGLASLSSTAPTLPAGYTHWGFIEAVRCGTTNTRIWPMIKRGTDVTLLPAAGTDLASDFPLALSGGTSSSLTAVSLQAFVPPTAVSAKLGLTHTGTTAGFSVVEQGSAGAASGILCQANTNGTTTTRSQFEAPDPFARGVFYAVGTAGAATIVCMGWKGN